MTFKTLETINTVLGNARIEAFEERDKAEKAAEDFEGEKYKCDGSMDFSDDYKYLYDEYREKCRINADIDSAYREFNNHDFR